MESKKEVKKELLCPRPGHKQEFVALCLNNKCAQNAFVCPKCICYFHSDCTQQLFFMQDIATDDLSVLLKNPKFKFLQAPTTGFIEDFNLVSKENLSHEEEEKIKFKLNEFKKPFLNGIFEHLKESKENLIRWFETLNQSLKKELTPEQEVQFAELQKEYTNEDNQKQMKAEVLNLKDFRENIKVLLKQFDDPKHDAPLKKYLGEFFEGLKKRKESFKTDSSKVILQMFAKSKCDVNLKGGINKCKAFAAEESFLEKMVLPPPNQEGQLFYIGDKHEHPLKFSKEDNGWECYGKNLEGGCVLGINARGQTYGMTRFKCSLPPESGWCEFDMCEKCLKKHLTKKEKGDKPPNLPPPPPPPPPEEYFD